MLGFPDDLRRYDISAIMLKIPGIKSVQLLTNNPNKIEGSEKFGIEVVSRIPLQIQHNHINRFSLMTKAFKSGHLLEFDELPEELDLIIKKN